MVLGTPNTKCAHGVYKAGREVAEYCSLCNPNIGFSSHRSPVSLVSKPEAEEEVEPALLDCAEFMDLNPGSRLAALGR